MKEHESCMLAADVTFVFCICLLFWLACLHRLQDLRRRGRRTEKDKDEDGLQHRVIDWSETYASPRVAPPAINSKSLRPFLGMPRQNPKGRRPHKTSPSAPWSPSRLGRERELEQTAEGRASLSEAKQRLQTYSLIGANTEYSVYSRVTRE